MRVTFENGEDARHDLVAGADGVYSTVRRPTFGPHADHVRHLGMSGVGFTTDNYLGLDHRGVLQSAPGRAVRLFSAADAARMTVILSFAGDSAGVGLLGRDRQEEIVRSAFEGVGWEAPRLLKEMSAASGLLFSSSCQVEMDRWSSGRVVLVGDAGYCLHRLRASAAPVRHRRPGARTRGRQAARRLLDPAVGQEMTPVALGGQASTESRRWA